ncbi:MAG: TFIIB-type zinc ribbon-containing protein [Candidatus Bathyarchaeota archaeon]
MTEYDLTLAELQVPDTCPECGSPTLRDHAAGEVVCRGCGLVVSTIIVTQNPEWSPYEPGDYESLSRGTPMILPVLTKGINTAISRFGWSSRDPETRDTMRRLNWMHRRTVSSRDRNFYTARNTLMVLGDQAAVPWSLRNQAANIYRKAYEHGLVRGRTIHDVMAGSIYTAYRLSRVPRTLKELAKAMDIYPKDLSRIYRLIRTELRLQPENQKAEDHVPRLAEALGFTGEEARAAIDMLRKARHSRQTAGKHPRGLAAAALYIVSRERPHGLKITQQAIAKASGITEVSIRNLYKRLQEVC